MTYTAAESYVYVGGEKGGLVRKVAGDVRWEHLTRGLPSEMVVVQAAVHPRRPEMVLVGTRGDGAYQSVDGGDSWRHVDLPETGLEVWSFAFHPDDSNTLYLGTAPPRIYRSTDGGDTWQSLPIVVDPEAERDIGYPTRIIAMAVNPSNAREIYAGMEVAGMIRSLDGGESWESINNGLAPDEGRVDIHGVAMSPSLSDTVFMITRMGPWRSRDRGNNWEFLDLKRFSPITHTRDLKADPHDANTFYMGVGAGVYGDVGSLMRSRDLGQTWERIDKGMEPNSTVRAVSVSPREQSLVYCCTRYGQVFGTHDGGETWQQYPLPESVTELRAVAVS